MHYTLTMRNGVLQLPEELLKEFGLATNATVNIQPAGTGLLLEPTDAVRDAPHETIYLQQFTPRVQKRFNELMDRSNEGELSENERKELAGLVKEYERLMLDNSETLVLAAK